VSDVNAWIIEAKRAMVATAGESIVLADHEKWGRIAFASFAGLNDLSTIISGVEAPADLVQSVKDQGVDVITV
jgi:DeoR/GlpR family transcriptional regulator of sugar metabolism